MSIPSDAEHDVTINQASKRLACTYKDHVPDLAWELEKAPCLLRGFTFGQIARPRLDVLVARLVVVHLLALAKDTLQVAFCVLRG